VAERLRGGLNAGDAAQLGRERVSGSVHVEPGAHAVTDAAWLAEAVSVSYARAGAVGDVQIAVRLG
jgi:hypothetical protein